MRPAALGWAVLAGLTWAYNPPVDTAGPLTVSMQAPATGAYGAGGFVELSRPGTPMSLPVTLVNASDRALNVTLRVAAIDRWEVQPAGPVAVTVPPRGRQRREFTLRFGPGTYNANYPVHAYAEFDYEGKRLTAHPVLLLQTRIPDLVRPRLPVRWAPVAVPAGGRLGLWRNPVRRESASLASMGAEAGQVGREVFDAGSIILYGPLARTSPAREGIGLTLGPRLPSLRESVEAAAVEYALALPAATQARLEYSTAGAAAFEVKVAPFEGGTYTTLARSGAGVDLSSYSGQHIRLKLEAGGAAGEAQWIEPTIVAGSASPPPAFPPAGEGRRLGTAGGCAVHLWPGTRGMLDAPFGFL